MAGNINQISSIQQLQLQRSLNTGKTSSGFNAILQEQLKQSGEVQFSKHAAERVEERGIEVTQSFLTDLNGAVEKAQGKGVRDMVVIANNGAFIVNVPNKTVITSMSTNEMKDNIFTNIDSAVIM